MSGLALKTVDLAVDHRLKSVYRPLQEIGIGAWISLPPMIDVKFTKVLKAYG